MIIPRSSIVNLLSQPLHQWWPMSRAMHLNLIYYTSLNWVLTIQQTQNVGQDETKKPTFFPLKVRHSKCVRGERQLSICFEWEKIAILQPKMSPGGLYYGVYVMTWVSLLHNHLRFRGMEWKPMKSPRALTRGEPIVKLWSHWTQIFDVGSGVC